MQRGFAYRSVRLALAFATLLALVASASPATAADDVAGRCETCHKEKTPGIWRQWFASTHGEVGVSCVDCHQADRNDPDAFEHEGTFVATLVTPKDCGECHDDAEEEVGRSHHARAGQILDSDDAYLAHVVAGEPAAMLGCESCHGARIEIDPESPNKLSKRTWPNSGIGRINPDGSLGSCNACHTRHTFSAAQARRPEACAKCHLGPDHPQKEVFEESKHGNAYATHIDEMNFDADPWVVGRDYWAAPTCATCHMSATPNQRATHDVGERIAWTLRPVVSTKQENWEEKRDNMLDVCAACHGRQFAEGHFYGFDAAVGLWNEKFAKPSTRIMDLIREKKLLESPAAFSNGIEWTYWELWHHEGRRARHGAAMMGPDYTWWHGFYEVGKHFYFEFLPQARALGDPDVDALIDEILADPMHDWMGRSTEDLKAAIRDGELPAVYRDLFPAK